MLGLTPPAWRAEGGNSMTIKEVEQRTGLPRSVVRFYEKEGLIAPRRGG